MNLSKILVSFVNVDSILNSILHVIFKCDASIDARIFSIKQAFAQRHCNLRHWI